jgi:hypothetical protein
LHNLGKIDSELYYDGVDNLRGQKAAILKVAQIVGRIKRIDEENGKENFSWDTLRTTKGNDAQSPFAYSELFGQVLYFQKQEEELASRSFMAMIYHSLFGENKKVEVKNPIQWYKVQRDGLFRVEGPDQYLSSDAHEFPIYREFSSLKLVFIDDGKKLSWYDGK